MRATSSTTTVTGGTTMAWECRATGGTTTVVVDTMMARGSRVTGGTTMVTGGTMTATGGKTMGVTPMARGRKSQQHHHYQRTNCSTIVRTFTQVQTTWTYTYLRF